MEFNNTHTFLAIPRSASTMVENCLLILQIKIPLIKIHQNIYVVIIGKILNLT